MSGWEALIAGVIGAASAYSSSKAAKKQQEGVHDNWERRMAYEEEKVRRKQNTAGARMAPYLMEQMLKVYGQQSAGRGGFTLPIDEMMQNMDLRGRQTGIHNSSGRSGGYGSSSYYSYGDDAPSGRKSAFSSSETNDARKGSSFKVAAGNVDPEIDGYNGKVWDINIGSPSLEGAASGGSDSAWGTPAGAVGGLREATRGMGNTTTQTERGYQVRKMPWNMINEGSDQAFPYQQGDLATGGTLNVSTDGVDANKILAIGAKLGIGTGPKGTPLNASGNYGNGKFELSDIMDWGRSHPLLFALAKASMNLAIPGSGMIAGAGLNVADKSAAKKAGIG